MTRESDVAALAHARPTMSNACLRQEKHLSVTLARSYELNEHSMAAVRLMVMQWRSQGGARGAIAPPFFKNKS